MKKQQFSLSGEWNKLMNDSLARLSELIPLCHGIDAFVRIVNCIVSLATCFSPQVEQVLELCRDRLESLIPECEKIDSLIKLIKAIARVTKSVQPEWGILLNDCCDRVRTLLPECNNAETVIRALNCMTRIAPLIGTPVVSDNTSDSSPSPTNGEADNAMSETGNNAECPIQVETDFPDNKTVAGSKQNIHALSDRMKSPLGRPMTKEDLERIQMMEEHLKTIR